MMVYEYLAEQDLIDFAAATGPITGVVSDRRPEADMEPADIAAVTDLLHLNAAELTLLETPPWESINPGFRVSEAAGVRAISATNSGPFFAHSVLEQPRLWDVTLLGSDAGKLAWLSGSESVEYIATRFVQIVDRLGQMYRDYDDPTGYGRKDRFAMRALIWRSKIAVLLAEEHPDSILQAWTEIRESDEDAPAGEDAPA